MSNEITRRDALVLGASAAALAVTRAPSESSQVASQPPLKPVCPVRKTERPRQNSRRSMPRRGSAQRHTAQAALSCRHSSFSRSISRGVSMHCQNPLCW